MPRTASVVVGDRYEESRTCGLTQTPCGLYKVSQPAKHQGRIGLIYQGISPILSVSYFIIKDRIEIY